MAGATAPRQDPNPCINGTKRVTDHTARLTSPSREPLARNNLQLTGTLERPPTSTETRCLNLYRPTGGTRPNCQLANPAVAAHSSARANISIPLALIIAALNILFGQFLDNQWNRLWLNQSERQRTALLLMGIQKVLRLPHSILQSIGHTGATALALTLQKIGHLLPLAIGRSVPAVTLFITSNLMLWMWFPTLGAINTLTIGFWFLINKILTQPSQIKETEKNIQQDLALQRSKELIENCSTLRLAGAEHRAIQWWAEPQLSAHKLQSSLDWINTLQTWSTLVLVTLIIGSSIKIAPTLSDPWLVLSLVAMQLASVWEISFTLKTARDLKQNWQIAQGLLNSPSEWQSGTSNPGIIKGNLEVQNISFRYRPNTKLVLSNINFTIQAGSFVAIVGSTGSGKSTLLRVLLGLEEPLQGQIFVDGHDYRELQRDLFRRQIGSVLQDTGLVGSTMMEVIASGRQLSLEQAWSAAEDAGLGADLQTTDGVANADFSRWKKSFRRTATKTSHRKSPGRESSALAAR